MSKLDTTGIGGGNEAQRSPRPRPAPKCRRCLRVVQLRGRKLDRCPVCGVAWTAPAKDAG